MAEYNPTVCTSIPLFLQTGGNSPGLFQLFDLQERSMLSAQVFLIGIVPPTLAAYTLSCRWTNDPSSMGGAIVQPVLVAGFGTWTVSGTNEVAVNSSVGETFSNIVVNWEAPARYFQLWLTDQSGFTDVKVSLHSR